MADQRALHWRSGAFGILTHDGTVQVSGLVAGPFGIRVMAGDSWTVTHIPSGRRIWTLSTLDAAKQFCERILPLTNWESIRGEIIGPKTLTARLLEITDECDPCVEDGLVADEAEVTR